MAEIILPSPPRAPTLKGVVVDRHEVAREDLFSVTLWQGAGRRAKRRWFTSRAVALAYAADRSDDLGLLLVDLTERADVAE